MWGWSNFPDRWLPEWKWEYDVEKAKQLLKEAGYEDGFEVNLIPSIRGAPAEAEGCEAVGDMWLDIGVKANFQRIPYSAFSPQQRARTYQGFACHAVDPQEEPLVTLGFMFSPAGGYSSGLDHPYLTPRINAATGTFDTEERWAQTTEISSWLWDNTLQIGLYFSNVVYSLGPRVGSWEEHLSTGDPRRISGLEWAPHR